MCVSSASSPLAAALRGRICGERGEESRGSANAEMDSTFLKETVGEVLASACAVGFGVSLTASSLLRKLQN